MGDQSKEPRSWTVHLEVSKSYMKVVTAISKERAMQIAEETFGSDGPESKPYDEDVCALWADEGEPE